MNTQELTLLTITNFSIDLVNKSKSLTVENALSFNSELESLNKQIEKFKTSFGSSNPLLAKVEHLAQLVKTKSDKLTVCI